MATRTSDVTAESSASFATGGVVFDSWSVTARDLPLDRAVTVTFRDGNGGDVIGEPVTLEPGQSASGTVEAGDRDLSRGLVAEVDGKSRLRAAATIEVTLYSDEEPITYGKLRALGLVT